MSSCKSVDSSRFLSIVQLATTAPLQESRGWNEIGPARAARRPALRDHILRAGGVDVGIGLIMSQRVRVLRVKDLHRHQIP
jgi:hypothetical protein